MKLLLPEDKKPVHVTTMPIRWGDMDALGHINNTVYFRYFEEARVRWLTEGGRSMVEGGEGPVVVNVFCNFFSQVEYPGDLLIRQYISNVGRSSCDVWMTMERTDQPGRIVADGGCTMVWVNYAAQKSVRLPQWGAGAPEPGTAGAATGVIREGATRHGPAGLPPAQASAFGLRGVRPSR